MKLLRSFPAVFERHPVFHVSCFVGDTLFSDFFEPLIVDHSLAGEPNAATLARSLLLALVPAPPSPRAPLPPGVAVCRPRSVFFAARVAAHVPALRPLLAFIGAEAEARCIKTFLCHDRSDAFG